MKIKNLNFLEKHIEKIVIGIGLVFFLLVVWSFVLGQPYTVTVITRMGTKTVTPDQVEVMIRDQARKLENDYKKTETPFDEIPLPRWTDDFRDRMTGRFLPVDRLAMPFSSAGLDKKLGEGDPIPTPMRVVPLPPTATAIAPQADYAVLAAPADEQTAKQYAELVGNLKEPRDIRYVSVAATFDMEQWRDRLKAPDASPDQRIPEDWWRSRLFITDVILERQTLDAATRQWGTTTTIPSLAYEPFRSNQADNGEIKLTAAEVPALLDGIREAQDRIARPAFVELERGAWTPPGSKHQLSEAQAQELAEIQQRLIQLNRRAKAMQAGQRGNPGDALAPAGDPTDEPPAPGQPGQRRPGRNPRNPNPANSVQGQIAELEAQRDSLMGVVRANAPSPESQAPGNFRRPGDGRRPGEAPLPGQDPNAPMLSIPPIKIWAHDLTAKPGETYRYRITVAVLSPLFHINDVPREQYTQYFNKLSVASEPSAWSDAVQVDPERYYFVTAQDAARKQISIDVFRIFNGVWMRKSFDVRPGDTIGDAVQVTYKNQTESVDLNTDTMLVDIAFPANELSVSSNADQTRAIIYNLSDHTMQARTLGRDLSDPTYQRLLTEMQVRSAVAQSGGR